MANVKLPNFLNADQLHLHCELSAYDAANNRIDFTGSKTYSIGFMKEGLGFGIIDINIELTPSMQPIIEITFKDFYGNLAFGHSESKKIIENADSSANANELNYKSMFDLPYPKFTLILKGYLGPPVVLELNVKKLNVNLIPNDGSYEIKGVFIPNLYGFFSDMPYYFLKAVRALRINRAKTPDEKSDIENNYLSTWDIAVLGKEYLQNTQTIKEFTGDIEADLNALKNGLDGMFDIDWFKTDAPPIQGKTKIKEINIPGFTDLYFNIDPIVTAGNATNNLKIQGVKDLYKRNFDRLIIKNALLASLSENSNEPKKLNILTNHPKDAVQKGLELINSNLDAIKKFNADQLTPAKISKIRQITIKNVFDALIGDSAFLMGAILEAGLKGLKNDKTRGENKKKFGNYFPFVQDPASSDQQIPDRQSYEMINFVSEFVAALTSGIVADKRKGLETQLSASSNLIKKRISNIEVLSNNPFDDTNVNNFIESLLVRSGIAVSMFNDKVAVRQDGLFTFSTIASIFDDLIKSELTNVEDGLKVISASNSKYELKNFCNFLSSIITKDGEFLKNDKTTPLNINQPIGTILNEKYNLPNDPDTLLSLGEILNKYLSGSNGIDKNTYTSSLIFHNNLPYYARIDGKSEAKYLLFVDDPDSLASSALANASQEGSIAYKSDVFEFTEIKDLDTDIDVYDGLIDQNLLDLVNSKQIIDFEKLKKGSNDDIYFTPIDENSLITELSGRKHYVALMSIGALQYVWNLFGSDVVWSYQRKYLKSICDEISSKIKDNETKTSNEIKEVINQLETQYDVFYTQFHHICNNWRNLLRDLSSSQNIASEFETRYLQNGESKNGRVIFELPLNQAQNSKGNVINVEDSIVNTTPLSDTNSQTNVLSVMSNVCNLNNFMFLSVPGNALRDQDIQQIFTPFDRPVIEKDIAINNFFYVLFMPTPENRTSYNNNDSLYQSFNPQLKKDFFEIDFGSPNNTIIKSISLTTEDSKVTAESAIAISNLVDVSNSKKAKNLDCSALSIMEGRSYRLNGEMIGNAQIVPTQFFVVNRAPIFNGLYQIMKVKHHITPNNMITSFEAIKMKYAGNTDQFIFIPPITLKDLNISKIISKNFVGSSGNLISDSSASFGSFGAKDLLPQNKKYLGLIKPSQITKNKKALLDAIAFMEGTIGQGNYNGYDIFLNYQIDKNRKFGSFPNTKKFFDVYDQPHPLNLIRVEALNSSACGRYQFVGTTWKDIGKRYFKTSNLAIGNQTNDNYDFNINNQDLGGNFLLTEALKRAGISDNQLNIGLSDKDTFKDIAIAIQKVWQSVELALNNNYPKSIADMWEFYKEAYKIYDPNPSFTSGKV